METTTKDQPANGHLTATDQLANEVRLEILKAKKQGYLQARYDSEIEYRIADRLKDDNAKKAQMERLKRIEQAIEFIDEEVAQLDG